MLLAGCKGKNKATFAAAIDGLAHKSPRHLSHKLLAGCDHAAVRPTESHRNTEGLRFHGNNVGSSRWLDDAERNGFGDRNHEHRSLAVRNFGQRFNVFQTAEEVRRLNQKACGVASDYFFHRFWIKPSVTCERNCRQRHSLVKCVCGEHFAKLGMHAARHRYRSASRQADRHHHGFRRRRRAVIHGSIRNLHAGQLTDHRLKFKNRLQRSLRNLGLVRSVSRKKFPTRDQRVNDHWPIVVVSSGSKKTGVILTVLARALAKPVHNFRLRHLPRNFQVTIKAVLAWNRRKQLINRTRANCLEHGLAVNRRFG